jgi:hypothetical protein
VKPIRKIHLMLVENDEYDQILHAVLFEDDESPMLLQRDPYFGSDSLMGVIEKWKQFAHASKVEFEADQSVLVFLAELQEIEREYLMEQGSSTYPTTRKIFSQHGETF